MNYLGFFWIIFAHAIGDLGFQTPYITDHKQSKTMVMFAHCIIWAGCVGVALKYLNDYSSWKMGFLIIAHFFTDTWSVNRITKDLTDIKRWKFYNTIDQIFHLGQLLIVYLIK